MSTKKKTTNSTLSGSLDKLLKKYSNTQVATKFEQNIASIPYRDYETKEVEIFELFNIELFDITNTFITQLPSFIFIDDNKAKVFSGIEQYIKAKEEQTTFKGCLIKDITYDDVLLYCLNKINSNQYNSLVKAYAFSFLKNKFNISFSQLSEVIGVSKGHIINTISLLSMPEEIKNDIKNFSISPTIVRALNGLNSDEKKIEAYKEIKSKKLSSLESVNLVKSYNSKS